MWTHRQKLGRFLSLGRANIKNLPTTAPCYNKWRITVKSFLPECSSKVNLSGVNGNVIMSGCVDDNPDDEGREEAGSNTESFPRRFDRRKGSAGAGSQ